jgi:hypothetical protein
MKTICSIVAFLLMSCACFAQPSITTSSSLPPGDTGAPYSQTLAATGGTSPYTWSLTAGSLPAGLSLSTAGVIAGTPIVTGTFGFSVTVTDAASLTGSQTFSLKIPYTQLTVTSPATLPAGVVNAAYSQTLAASGGYPPYAWLVASGTLPTGLALSSNGVLSGTPTTLGTSTFNINVVYGGIFYASQSFSLTIVGAALAVTTSSPLPSGATGTAYSQTLAATGDVPPYTWSVVSGALPPGLILSSSGAISGTPTASGTYIFAVQVQDSTSLTASQPFSLTVTAPGVLTRLGILSQLSAGAGWVTTIWLTNRSAAPVQTNLNFYGDDGNPLTLPLTVIQPGTSLQATRNTVPEVIAPNTTLVVVTGSLTANVEGWVDVLSDGALSGFAVFSNGSVEASVPLQSQIGSSISLYFDNTNGSSTAVAIANLSGTPAAITATVWDLNGNLVTAQPVAVPLTHNDANGNGHDAFMLPARLAMTANIRGIVQFQGNPGSASVPAGPLTGLGLKTDPNGLYTSIPTMLP